METTEQLRALIKLQNEHIEDLQRRVDEYKEMLYRSFDNFDAVLEVSQSWKARYDAQLEKN